MDEERFTASDYINYLIKNKNLTIKDFEVGDIIIVSWIKGIIHSLAKKTFAKKPTKTTFFYDLPFYSVDINNKKISFMNLPMGASATIIKMEEMIALGGKYIIGVGLAGSLQKDIATGSIIIPTECISEEGTSKHYPINTKIIPSKFLFEVLKKQLLNKKIENFSGKHWTTDAVYRETINKINEYSNKGVLSVDMETSAMYTVGLFRNIEVCNIHIISDELWKDWEPIFYSNKLKTSIKKVEKIIINTILSIIKQID